MKKYFLIITLVLAFGINLPVFAEERFDLSNIGFHKKNDVAPVIQIKQIFEKYQKFCNSQNLNMFLNLHDASYRSADGYDIESLRELAIESWKEYPDVKYSIKVLSTDVSLDNAVVITKEHLSGTTDTTVEFVNGNGYIDSESTAVYYLKRFSNEWKIVSDFVLNEKTSIKYGTAKFIPMEIDAPALVAPKQEYTAILKMNVPRTYIALISISNEPITYPFQRSTEVFRSLKPSGIQERILTSNNSNKNENAVASVGIAKADIKNNDININIAGIAFLSSRVNVMSLKSEKFIPYTKETKADLKSEIKSGNK